MRQQQNLVVDVDIDLTWRGVYSVARSNYSQASAAEEVADDAVVGADGPQLLLSTPQLRKSVVKVRANPAHPSAVLLLFDSSGSSLRQALASKMESKDISTGSACMHVVCTSGDAALFVFRNLNADAWSVAVMREMVQLGIASYVIPETRRDIFSSDVEIGNQAMTMLVLLVARCLD